MLEELLRYINNRFDRDPRGVPYGSKSGSFKVEGGTLEIDGLLEGQYYWVEGSAFNDGLHQYQGGDMHDEEFDGKITFLVIPPAVTAIASEIERWLDNNEKALSGPYQSESFGGYSYTLAQGTSQGNENAPTAWQSKFGARLRPWRKLSRDWT